MFFYILAENRATCQGKQWRIFSDNSASEESRMGGQWIFVRALHGVGEWEWHLLGAGMDE